MIQWYNSLNSALGDYIMIQKKTIISLIVGFIAPLYIGSIILVIASSPTNYRMWLIAPLLMFSPDILMPAIYFFGLPALIYSITTTILGRHHSLSVYSRTIWVRDFMLLGSFTGMLSPFISILFISGFISETSRYTYLSQKLNMSFKMNLPFIITGTICSLLMMLIWINKKKTPNKSTHRMHDSGDDFGF